MPGDLILTFVSLAVRYPPVSRFKGNERAAFYAELHGTHAFESFREIGDHRAEMATEGERRFEFERDNLRIDEYVSGNFEVTLKHTVDLLKQTRQQFRIPAFYLPWITMRGLRPIPESLAPSSGLLRDRVVALDADQYQLLGNVDGSYVTLVGEIGPPEIQYDLEIAPYWRDETNLHIAVEAHSHESFENPEVLGALVQTAYDFISKPVMRFIDAFTIEANGTEEEGDGEET